MRSRSRPLFPSKKSISDTDPPYQAIHSLESERSTIQTKGPINAERKEKVGKEDDSFAETFHVYVIGSGFGQIRNDD